jgi:AraC family transcriptional regulator
MTQTAEKTEGGPTPRFENGKAMRIAGLSGRFGNENRAQIPALWQRLGAQYFGRTSGQVDKKAYGVCSNMDDKANLDYLAGVEVASFAGLPAELTQMNLTPHRYAVFAHLGHVSAVSRTWMDIFEIWLPRAGYAMAAAPSFECYGEAFDPVVAIGHVEIWIPLKT